MALPVAVKALFHQVKATTDQEMQYQLLAMCEEPLLRALQELLCHEVKTPATNPQMQLDDIELLLVVAGLRKDQEKIAWSWYKKGDTYFFAQHAYGRAADAYQEAFRWYRKIDDDQKAATAMAKAICSLALDGREGVASHQLATQRTLLLQQQALLTVAQELKTCADQQTYKADGIAVAARIAQQIHWLAEQSQDVQIEALGLRAEGNVHLYSQDYQAALRCYDQAATLYRNEGQRLAAAGAEVGAIGALAQQGRYHEAEAKCKALSEIFREHEEWHALVKTLGNLSVIYDRMGADVDALAAADGAKQLCTRLGEEGLVLIPLLENNRAVTLRNLGRFSEAMQASQRSWNSNVQLGQSAEAARALQTMAFTYFLQGHYNQALQLYAQATAAFMAGGRQRDALVGETEVTDCLLQLRRFPDVLEKCTEIQCAFGASGVQDILIRSYLNQATAYASKHPPDYEKAMQALETAQQHVEPTEQSRLTTDITLTTATIVYLQAHYHDSLQMAADAADVLQQRGSVIDAAFAWLIAARSALMQQMYSTAYRFVLDAERVAQSAAGQAMPFLGYQVHMLLGTLAQVDGDYRHALAEYEEAITILERLRGQVMVEFTFGFLEDKQAAYEELVTLSIEKLDDPAQAWRFAERAKSRALLDLITHHIDLRVRSRHPEDDQLVQELSALRAEHNRLYRRRQEERRQAMFAADHGDLTSAQQTAMAMRTVEEALEKKWNHLLLRNADYALDHTIAVATLEEVQGHLEPECAILEYFATTKMIYVFLIKRDSIAVWPLCPPAQLHHQLTFLRMNLDAVPRSGHAQIHRLLQGAQGILHELYQTLMAPLQEQLTDLCHLIIVPHGQLHSLPFHALYDGAQYVIETYSCSYLPSASLLPLCRQSRPQTQNAVIFAHTQGGTLLERQREGAAIRELLQGTCYVDEEATLARIHEEAPHCRVLHLATHGQFNIENPLFSGLAFEDGELTTYDIFNLQLSASLVVLSACETAKAKVRGGDELIGLSRAVLYAGAKSLIISHWKVEDESTRRLMVNFYQHLMANGTKAQALQAAQRFMIQQQDEPLFQHPYFWSAFFLMGDAGTL